MNIGKPYEGKLHVRFDEGELKNKTPRINARCLKSIFYSILCKVYENRECALLKFTKYGMITT